MAGKCSNESVVVWEYLDNALQWVPYGSDVCVIIEKSFNRNLKSLRLGDVKPKLSMYTISFNPLEQVRVDTGTVRPIRRSLYAADCCPGKGISWQWRDIDWCPYSVEIQDAIEAYKGSKQLIDLQSHSVHLPYIVNLSSMMQISKISRNELEIRRKTIKPYLSVECTDDSKSSCSQNENNAPFMSSVWSTVSQFLKPRPSSSTSNAGAPAATSPRQTSIKSATIKTARRKPTIKKYSSKLSVTHTLVDNPSPENKMFTPEELLQNFTKPAALTEPEKCVICYEDLGQSSGYSSDSNAVSFVKCEHSFHRDCLDEMLKSGKMSSFMQCPVCKMIYGQKMGTQPPGTMTFFIYPKSLPGFKDCDTITIIYDFQSGIQGPEHPNPGKRYRAHTFPRHCYLPNNTKGRKVLDLLCVAWKQRLIFTIGTSVTNGSLDVVTWNEIHHKTEFGTNYSGHGYPDADYLDNVLKELESHGIIDEEEGK